MRSHPVPLALVLTAGLALVAGPAPAEARRRPLSVRVPAFSVPPRQNREVCTFVKVPVPGRMEIGQVLIANEGGNDQFTTHHMIVYAYSGSFAKVAAIEGKAIDDEACLDSVPDPGTLQIVATSQAIRSLQKMPAGTALALDPQTMPGGRKMLGLVLNSHWINSSDETRKARVKVKFVPARKRDAKQHLKPIFEVVANGFIEVPPGAKDKTVSWTWGPRLLNVGSFLGGADYPLGPACVTMLIAHMHRRGTLFTADFVDFDGTKTRLYETTQYADPPTLRLDPPLLVRPREEPGRPPAPGQHIQYTCTHDNATDPKLGCEEEPGVAPGVAVIRRIPDFDGAAAKGCAALGPNPTECPATDPAYPERSFTGNCVPANLVFGFTSEDDMCILPGYYYDGNPEAPPGHECDL